jgi:hypothetical protein
VVNCAAADGIGSFLGKEVHYVAMDVQDLRNEDPTPHWQPVMK